MNRDERLEDIKECLEDGWFCDNPNCSDVADEIKYLLTYADKYQSLKEQNTKLQAALEVATIGLIDATYRHHMDCDKECVDICPVKTRVETLSEIEELLK